jgi:hypothetical protein
MTDATAVNDDGDNSTPSTGNKTAATSEAGLVRGAARSLGSSGRQGIAMMRLPTVGRLPVAAPTHGVTPTIFRGRVAKIKTTSIPRRIPVKKVAKVSDQVSQGMSLYDSAAESSSSNTSVNTSRGEATSSRWKKFTSFASSRSCCDHVGWNVSKCLLFI